MDHAIPHAKPHTKPHTHQNCVTYPHSTTGKTSAETNGKRSAKKFYEGAPQTTLDHILNQNCVTYPHSTTGKTSAKIGVSSRSVCGVWCVHVWCVVCGVWCVVCGVVCGVWCVVCACGY